MRETLVPCVGSVAESAMIAKGLLPKEIEVEVEVEVEVAAKLGWTTDDDEDEEEDDEDTESVYGELGADGESTITTSAGGIIGDNTDLAVDKMEEDERVSSGRELGRRTLSKTFRRLDIPVVCTDREPLERSLHKHRA